MKIEDKIQFGKYVWRVLAIEDDRALIITEKLLSSVPIITSMSILLGRIALFVNTSTLSSITVFRKKRKIELSL